MKFSELNLPQQLQVIKGLGREYHKAKYFERKEILCELLESIENMDLPEVIFVDETLNSEWEKINNRSEELRKSEMN